MQLSPHFSLEELTVTHSGLPNIPSDFDMERLTCTASSMESVRAALGHQIHVNSGFRSELVNHAAGGAKNSAHMRGEAVDFVCPAFGNPQKICLALIDSGIKFDQLILEPTWVHIGFGEKLRQQVMTKTPTGYAPGLHGNENT